MKAIDGKYRNTDVADTETIFRLIQSVPSPKAEPFKLWLSKVGYERLEEIADPELAFNRAMQTYLRKGYSRSWINQRLKSIEIRKELTGSTLRSDNKEITMYNISKFENYEQFTKKIKQLGNTIDSQGVAATPNLHIRRLLNIGNAEY